MSAAPFAPGVISVGQRPPRRAARAARLALRWGWRAVSVACVLIVLLGLLGLSTGSGARVAPACVGVAA